MDQTALLVPVPRIGPLVDPWRRRYDRSAAGGVPPHVTIMYPFLPPSQVTAATLDELRALVAAHPVLDVDLAEVGVFDTDVLYLRPVPDRPFRDLTAAVQRRYPGVQPYEGRHPEVIPHLTVGHQIPRASARHAARVLMLALPVRVRADVVQLWVGGADGWQRAASFALGIGAPAPA